MSLFVPSTISVCPLPYVFTDSLLLAGDAAGLGYNRIARVVNMEILGIQNKL
jgi:hypothetical protein